MLFTWDTTNLCIVFRGWRIDGTISLILSLLAIVLLTAGYEAIRDMSRRYEAYAQVGAVEGRRGGDVRGEFSDFFAFFPLSSMGWDEEMGYGGCRPGLGCVCLLGVVFVPVTLLSFFVDFFG